MALWRELRIVSDTRFGVKITLLRLPFNWTVNRDVMKHTLDTDEQLRRKEERAVHSIAVRFPFFHTTTAKGLLFLLNCHYKLEEHFELYTMFLCAKWQPMYSITHI